MKAIKYIRWIIAILFILIFIFWVKSFKKDGDEKVPKDPKEKTAVKSWVVEGTKTVEFNNKYSKAINFPSGRGLSFEGATEPYCVKNLSGEKFSAEKGEDVGTQIPNTNSNTKLWIKSKNGKSGQVTITIWILSKK